MASPDKLVGVIGGMGPGATVDFMTRVMANTPADIDQQHIRMLVEHNPRIPNRQIAMGGGGEDPGATIAEMARRLETAGADFIVMPCNLAHAWQADIDAVTNIPFVSIVTESVRAAVSLTEEGSAMGLLTTPGCFTAGLYQQALADSGRPSVLQTPDELAATMMLVNQIKSGNVSDQIGDQLRGLANELVVRGASVVIAACTEFPLVIEESMFDVALVSSTDVLARATVALALDYL